MACCEDAVAVPRVDPTELPAAGMSTKPRVYEPSMWEIMRWSQCQKKQAQQQTTTPRAPAAMPQQQQCSCSCVANCCTGNPAQCVCTFCDEQGRCVCRVHVTCCCSRSNGTVPCFTSKATTQQQSTQSCECKCSEGPTQQGAPSDGPTGAPQPSHAPPQAHTRGPSRRGPQPAQQPRRPRPAAPRGVAPAQRPQQEQPHTLVAAEEPEEVIELVDPADPATAEDAHAPAVPHQHRRRRASATKAQEPQGTADNGGRNGASTLFYRVRPSAKGNDPASVAERRRRKALEQAERAKREMIQNSRFLPDSSYKRYFRKPAFHLYGNKNVKPVRGGVVYGNYLTSHNVNPLMHRATPKEQVLFNQSKRTYKAAVRAMVSPVLHAEAHRSNFAQPKTSLEVVGPSGERMQLRTGEDLASLNRSVADVLMEERKARGQSSMDDECLEYPVGGHGRQLLDTAVSRLEEDSIAGGPSEEEDDDDVSDYRVHAYTAGMQRRDSRPKPFRKLRNEIAWSALSSSQHVRPSTAGPVIGARTRVSRRPSKAQPRAPQGEPQSNCVHDHDDHGELRGTVTYAPPPAREAPPTAPEGKEAQEEETKGPDMTEHSSGSLRVWGDDGNKPWYGRRVSTASEELLVKEGRIPAGRGAPLGMDLTLDRVHDIRESQDSSAVRYSMVWPHHKQGGAAEGRRR